MTLLHTLRSAVASRIFGQLLSGERGAKRIRLAGFSIAANVLSKGLGFLVIIYSTRVALEQLGPQRFGVWVTIATISTLLGFMDLGVSNALIGRVAALSSTPAPEEKLRKLVSAGLTALLAVGLVVAVMLLAAFAVAPLTLWFKGISAAVAGEARLTGYVFALLFGMSLAAQGVFKVYVGMQYGWITHLAGALGWLLSLLLLAAAPGFQAPMWFYLFATYGIQQLAGLALAYGLVRRGLIERPRNLVAQWNGLKNDEVFRQGQMFFIIQVAFAIGWGANQFILSSMIGPAEAASFSVLQRLFMVVQVALTIFNLPLWAMYADAYSHRELGFVRSLLKRSLATTLFCSCVGVIILILGERVFVGILAGNRLAIPESSIVIMAVWTVVEACGIAFSMYLNGVARIRPQAITGVVHTLAGLPVKVIAVHYFGLNGLLLAIIATYVVLAAIPLVTVFRAECFDRIITD